MSGRVGQPPKPTQVRTSAAAKTAPARSSRAESRDAALFDNPVKKLVNMTGRYKPVSRAPVPVKEELRADVSKLRAAAMAGPVAPAKATGDVKKALDRIAKGESLDVAFKGLDAAEAKDAYARLPAASRKAVEKAMPAGDASTVVRMGQVQNMSTDQLREVADAMRSGKVKDPSLELCVATEIAARTDWGKENPELVDMQRYLVLEGKLGFEDLSASLHKDPEGLVESMVAHTTREYDEMNARVGTAVKSAPNPRGAGRINHVDGKLSPTADYKDLPSDLKSKMSAEVWASLGDDVKQRTTLLSTYSRLRAWGVWDQVKAVKGELNPVEAHAHVGGAEFEVAGNTGGVVFQAKDARKFKEALINTGHFGVDKGIVGSLHQGQDSTREWTDDPGSLHVSIGPGDQFDTHMDKHSPVKQPKNGETQIDPEKGFDHHRNEVWPEMIRKVLGLPGVIVDAEVRPGSRDGGADVRGTVSVELHGPVKSQKKKVDQKTMDKINQAPGRGESGPEGVMADVLAHLDLSKTKFPRPAGVVKSNALDPQAVAEHLAAKMLEAARSGKNPIELDLVDYAHLKNLQPEMLNQLEKLGSEVHRQLEAALARLPKEERAAYDLDAVTRMRVTFGVKTQGGTVSLTDKA